MYNHSVAVYHNLSKGNLDCHNAAFAYRLSPTHKEGPCRNQHDACPELSKGSNDFPSSMNCKKSVEVARDSVSYALAKALTISATSFVVTYS